MTRLEPHFDRDGDDPNTGNGPRVHYHCTGCCWHSRDYMAALEHHVQAAHQIEIQNMSHWGPVTFPDPYVRRMRARQRRTA